jgi:hypothetical protein
MIVPPCDFGCPSYSEKKKSNPALFCAGNNNGARMDAVENRLMGLR